MAVFRWKMKASKLKLLMFVVGSENESDTQGYCEKAIDWDLKNLYLVPTNF